MSELISGKEALIALASGKEVEYWCETDPSIQKRWALIKNHNEYKLSYFLEDKPRFEFRLKPHTISINGIKVPAPEKNDDPDLELLEHDQDYWLVDLANYPNFVILHKWKGDPPECAWADRGLIHLSKDAALLHAKALILASGGAA